MFFNRVRRESNCRPGNNSLYARFVCRTSPSVRYLVYLSDTLTEQRVLLGFLVIIYIRKRSNIWIGYFEFDFVAVQLFGV